MHAGLHFTPVAMAVFTGRSGRFFHRSSEDLSTAGQGDHPKLLHNQVKRRPAALGADVGFEGLSGNRMLDQSITGFDPQCVVPGAKQRLGTIA